MMLFSLPAQPMDYFEGMYRRRGYRQIAGVDEVGRGPLAGPVVAAAVILPEKGIPVKLLDSKQLSPQQREELYPVILSQALGVGVGTVGPEEIDRVNILQATFQAMIQAIERLPFSPDFLLIDGNQGLRFSVPQKSIPKGDRLSNSIAAASIVAKVTRDRMMDEYHRQYPQYNFAKHKGYGTKEHQQAIKAFGVCDLHRKTFRGVKEYIR
jgi:ribonuclease HII